MVRSHLLFLSTLSLRRATKCSFGNPCKKPYFYPRSPCGERPSSTPAVRSKFMHFYPRSPCGERPRALENGFRWYNDFYPRSPCGERPAFLPADRLSHQDFLSTLSLRSATGLFFCRCVRDPNFYPRSPCGERQMQGNPKLKDMLISIHALLAESDKMELNRTAGRITFLSTLSLRRATYYRRQGSAKTSYFYPRSPCGERPDFY